MIHWLINSIIDPHLPHEQTGFHKERSTVDQVALLTQDTAGAVLVDLTAAFDIVWHQGFNLKILWMLDKHVVHFIVELISNCSFVLKTSEGQ